MTVSRLDPGVGLATHVWPPLASVDEVPTVLVGVIINVCAALTVSVQELVSWLYFFFLP